ncbi:MAG: alpha/beta hydrolase [Burkholderiaceae bacterium]
MTVTPQDPPIVLETGPHPDAAVIWLHGLGADGHDFEAIVPALGLPEPMAIRFIFPHAPVRPVTLNNGMAMRAWYDIIALGGQAREDDEGIRASGQVIEEMIDQQIASGISANRIVIAGFSQGGAIALYAGTRSTQRLAGVMALSTYLVLADKLAEEKSSENQDVPILMVHGLHDQVVPLERGRMALDALQSQDYSVQWEDYPMGHEVCMPEVQVISKWLQTVL